MTWPKYFSHMFCPANPRHFADCSYLKSPKPLFAGWGHWSCLYILPQYRPCILDDECSLRQHGTSFLLLKADFGCPIHRLISSSHSPSSVMSWLRYVNRQTCSILCPPILMLTCGVSTFPLSTIVFYLLYIHFHVILLSFLTFFVYNILQLRFW